MAWPRRSQTASESGRLLDLGQDHSRGHAEYVRRIGEDGRRWLRTKPFSAPPSPELPVCLHTFAHIVTQLRLGVHAEILDVGCGPGWLSEFLARCGYSVTGIDISEDMVVIARERVARIDRSESPFPPRAEFHAMPVLEMPWEGRFDAAILYDTLHHFHDEEETLRAIGRALAPGGRLYIREGARPPSGSAGERALVEEMQTYGTLESPFDPRYLCAVVAAAGFEDVRRLMDVDELVDATRPADIFRLVKRWTSYRRGGGETNTILARRPIDVAAPPPGSSAFRARFDLLERGTEDGRHVLRVRVANEGGAVWPAAPEFPFPPGSVTVGPVVGSPEGERNELPRITLPRTVPPGDAVDVEIRVPISSVGESDEILVDLVREQLFWFSDLGAAPLRVRLDG